MAESGSKVMAIDIDQRKQVIEAAKAANPQRWSGSIRNLSLPDSVTLNPERRLIIKELIT